MIQFQHPKVLIAVFAVLPAAFFVFSHFKKLSQTIAGFYGEESKSKIYKNLRARIILKTFFRSLSWICAVLAFSGPSWGRQNVPVPKSGSSVCFVFDISWSMMAADCPNKMTRLDAVKVYAANLLALLPGSSFSAVLAKGDGFAALPETDDAAALLSLIANLNPNLVSSPGSSLGKGIHAAVKSIAKDSAKQNYIWVFTDGDETDSSLKNALEEAESSGIQVSLVGFGSEKESEILTGDKKTKVKTALRAKKMKEISNSYVSAEDAGSAYFLVNQIKSTKDSSGSNSFSYEVVPIKRHGLFIALSLIFLMISFVAEEFSLKRKSKISAVSFCFLLAFSLTSCGSENHQKEILKGSWNFYQGKYRAAMAEFLNETVSTKEDSMAHQYALFGLSSTYIAVSEYDSALDRINQMMVGTAVVPAELESAAYYNAGIIFVRKNDFLTASEYFKKAILSNPEYVDAKINLEFCNRHLEEKNANQNQDESEMQKVSQSNESNSQMQNEIFNIIRENENKQWKKMQSSPSESNVLDY